MRNVYASIQHAQKQRERKAELKETICFIAVFAMFIAGYIALGV